jgi:hypothetical protein
MLPSDELAQLQLTQIDADASLLQLASLPALTALCLRIDRYQRSEAFAELQALSALSELRMTGLGVLGHGAVAADGVCGLLTAMASLTQLSIADAPFDDACAAELAPVLGRCTQLQHLELCSTRRPRDSSCAGWLHYQAMEDDFFLDRMASVGAAGAQPLVPALAQLTRLTTLRLTGHLDSGDSSARALAARLTELQRLRPCGDKREPFGSQPDEWQLGPALGEGGREADVLSYIGVSC